MKIQKSILLGLGLCIFISSTVLASDYSQELQDAYQFAYQNNITTMNSIDKADMNGGLTRIAMAKMLSQYAINILGKSPDTTKIPNFGDVDSKLDGDYNNGVTLAYQLGIMGVGIDKFRPFDSVTRAEFGTALSRVLYGDQYEGGSQYYTNHLNALKTAGIMTQISHPNQLEVRGYVMLMLMRSKGNNHDDSNCDDPLLILLCEQSPSECPLKCKISEKTNTDLNANSNIISSTGDDTQQRCIIDFRDTLTFSYLGRYDGLCSEIREPIPTRKSDKTCDYIFSGYDKKFLDENEVAKYYSYDAQFTCTMKLYTVKWVDYDGVLLQEDKVGYKSETPLYKGKTPTKNGYVFIGWQGAPQEIRDGSVEYDITYHAIYGDTGVEISRYAYGGSQCKKYYTKELSGMTFLYLPYELIEDGWYFIGCNNNQSDNSQTNNEANNADENIDTLPSPSNNNSLDNSSGDDSLSGDNPSTIDSGNDESLYSEDSSDNSGNSYNSDNSTNNSKNCVDIGVDDGNSYSFCITKWKSNSSKYSVSVTNSEDLSLCTVGRGGQNWNFYNCKGDITGMGSSGTANLRLTIKYNNKEYTKKIDYDLTNGVFVD